MKTLFIVWARHSRRAATMATELKGTVCFLHDSRFKQGWLTPLRYLVQSWRTWRLLEQERPQAVLVQAPPVFAALVVAIWCILRSRTGTSTQHTRYAIDCHSGTFYDNRWRWTLPLQRLLSRHAAVTVVACEDALQRLHQWHVKGVFLVDGLPRLSMPTGSAGTQGEKRVAVVSSFEADEPIDEIFAAASMLPDITFYFSGDATRLRPHTLARKPENAFLTGFLPDSAYSALLHNVQGLLILTTEPNVLNCGVYEALVTYKPAVLSDWPLMRRCFPRGFVYVQNTSEAIAIGIQRLFAEHDILTRDVIMMRSELAEKRRPVLEEFVSLLQGETITQREKIMMH